MTSIEHVLTQQSPTEAHQVQVLDDDPIGDIKLGMGRRKTASAQAF